VSVSFSSIKSFWFPTKAVGSEIISTKYWYDNKFLINISSNKKSYHRQFYIVEDGIKCTIVLL